MSIQRKLICLLFISVSLLSACGTKPDRLTLPNSDTTTSQTDQKL
ncbi:hypothetical protein [Reinekea marinisedimentorum]|nr:hypothetical protein [Reinekea marinisedimentorum]